MENKDQNTPASGTVVTPTPQGSGASYTNANQNPQTPNSSPASGTSPLDAPIVPSENSLETPQTPTSNFTQATSPSVQVTPNNSVRPQKKGFNKVFLVIGGIAVLILIAVIVTVNIVSKRQASQLQSPAQSVNEQGITLGSATPDTLTALQLEGSQNKLIVNGDIIVNGRLAVASGEFFGQFVVNNLTANRSYTLPDADGTICLDTNNCNYATSGNEVNSINGVNGILTLGEGLGLQGTTIVNTQNELTVNEVISSIVFQGTNNQVGITKNGNVISFTTPQDIAVASSPTFNSITLTVAGTQNGNEICDISNNCGYAGGTNAFVQNGNSFDETAVLGTNDDFNLAFETNGVVGMELNTDSQVRVGNVDDGFLGALTVASDNEYNIYSSGTSYNYFEGRTAVGNIADTWLSLAVLSVGESTTSAGIGLANALQVDAAGSHSTSYGLLNELNTIGVQDYDASIGLASTLRNTSSGTTDSAVALGSQVVNDGVGTITDAYGLSIATAENSGGGTITNNYGLYIQDQSGIGSSSSYNLYSDGASSQNYFAGNVGINNTTTPNRLSVNTLTTSAPLAQAAIATGAATNKGLIVQGAALQTADLLQLQDSTGVSKLTFGPSGGGYALIVTPETTDVFVVRANAGSGASSNVAIQGTDNGGDRSAFYVNGAVAGNTFQTGTTSTFNTKITSSASNIGLVVQGAVSQTANLQEWQNSSGTVLASVGPAGRLTVNPTTSTSTTAGSDRAVIINFTDSGALTSGSDVTSAIEISLNRSGASGTAVTDTRGIGIGVFGDTGGTATVQGIVSLAGGGDINYGVGSAAMLTGSAASTTSIGVYGHVNSLLSFGASSTAAYGLQGSIGIDGGVASITTAAGLHISTATNTSGGTITSNYGILVDAQTVGTSDYGLRVDTADTQTLWIGGTAAGDAGTANTGIAFGSSRDTNLYRSAADTLKTDDSLDIGTKLQVGASSVVGTFSQCGSALGPFTCTNTFESGTASTETTTSTYGANFVTGITPAGATNVGENRAINATLGLYGTQSFTAATGNIAVNASAVAATTSGTIAILGGVSGTANVGGSGSTVTEAFGLQGSIQQTAGTVTNAYGLRVLTATGTFGTNYGIHVQTQTGGTSDYGIRVDAADTQTLWISGNANNTTAAAGIAFGSSRDTNLYRSAADTLKTDDSLQVTNNVGIGVAPGSYKLDVNTDAASYVANFFNDGNDQNRYGIRIQAGADDGSGTTYYLDAYDGDGSQVGYIANTSGTFALTDVSDVRTKTNIVDTSVDALNVLSGLRVVDFNRLQNPDGPLITGFIAQEVQGVYSQAVTTGANGLLGVAKEAFIPVLVKGIQQQQGQITALTNQVGSLQNIDGRLVALEQQVDDLSVPQNQGSTFANLNVSGAAVLQNLTVTGDTSIASLTVTGNAYIAGNITLQGHVLGNADTRGSVTIPAGQTEFKQTFQKRYTAGSQPNVILTPKNTFAPNYRVESTDTDFTVYFETPADVDVVMNYQVQE